MKKRQNHMIKTFAVILCAALLLLSVPFSVLAEDAETTKTIEECVAEMLAEERAPGEIVVKFFSEASTQNALDVLNSVKKR